MKYLTILDYSNILALMLSTLLVVSSHFFGWSSSYMTLMMVVFLIFVVINVLLNRKYRTKAREGQAIIIQERDQIIAMLSIGIMLIMTGILLLMPGLR